MSPRVCSSFARRASAVLALIALSNPLPLLAEPAHKNLLSMRSSKLSLNLEPPTAPPPPPDTQTLLVPKPRTSPFNVKLSVDLPILAGTTLGIFLPQMIGWKSPDPPSDPRRDQINAMDRGVPGNWSPAADQASTVLLATTIVLPFAASLVDTWVNKPEDGYWGFAKDALVLAETYAATTLLTNIIKLSVSRPRPYVYNTSLSPAIRNGSDAMHSFPSGHVTMAFSMATSYSYLFTLRHPGSKLVIPVWIGTHALAAATALLRVEAGQHFWSDILVGAALGSAIGFLVPYLHKKDNFFARLFSGSRKGRRDLHLTIGAGLGLSGRF